MHEPLTNLPSSLAAYLYQIYRHHHHHHHQYVSPSMRVSLCAHGDQRTTFGRLVAPTQFLKLPPLNLHVKAGYAAALLDHEQPRMEALPYSFAVSWVVGISFSWVPSA